MKSLGLMNPNSSTNHIFAQRVYTIPCNNVHCSPIFSGSSIRKFEKDDGGKNETIYNYKRWFASYEVQSSNGGSFKAQMASLGVRKKSKEKRVVYFD